MPGFAEIEGVELAAVCNRSEASGRAVAEAFGIAQVETDWLKVARNPDIDAVCIGTWPNLHAEATIACLEMGKHVLCEARMARNLAEAQTMLAVAEAHPELVVQIVPSPFTLGVDGAIRELLDSGKLGELREVRVVQTLPGATDPTAPLSWRLDHELSGMNTLMLGIFHEAVQRWIGEEPEWVSANAEIFTRQRPDPQTGELREVQIPDVLTVLGRWPSGARLNYHMSGIETEPSQEIRLNGSKAGLRVLASENKLIFTPNGGQPREIAPENSPGWQVEREFVDAIREGRPVERTHPRQGVAYMEFTERVWRSWNQQGARIGRLI